MTICKIYPPKKPVAVPRFSEADKVGKSKVLEYLGYGHQFDGALFRQKKQHAYRMECHCGKVYTRLQDCLVSGRTQCKECAYIAREKAKSSARIKKTTSGCVPDFSRMKLSGTPDC